jgi:hypothetical protein
VDFAGLPAGEAPGVANDGAGGTDIGLVQTTFTITSEAELVTDTALVSQGGANAGENFNYTFILVPPSGTIALDPLSALALESGSILTVTGDGGGLDGTLSLSDAVSLLPSAAGASGLTFSDGTANLTTAALIEGYAGTGGAGGGLGVDMSAGGTLTNSATIEGGSGATGGEGVLLNDGSLDNALGALILGGAATAGSNQYGGAGVAMNGGTLTNDGTIAGGGGSGGQDGATGLNLFAGTVSNAGLIEGGAGGSGGSADGIYTGGSFTGTIKNSGTIEGGSGVAGGEGVALNGGSLDNASGGLILGGAATGNNLGLGLGVGLGGGALLTNEGTIEGGSSTGGSGATGVNLFTGTLVNSGFVEAGAGGDAAGVYIAGGLLVTSGTIAANPAGAGNEAVLFSGAGTMVVDPGATFVGAVLANTADTIELGGSTAGTLDGFGTQITGLGTLLFEAGATWTVAGDAAGLADGQVLAGFAAGDTIDLTGVGTETTETPDGGGSFTLSGAGATTATLDFGAPLPAGDTLALESDGSGGTLAWLVQNGPPVIAVSSPQIVGVGQPSAIGGLALSETGDTANGETFTVTLTDTNGALSAPGGIVSGSGSNTLVVSGSLAQVNAALALLIDTDAVLTADTIVATASDSLGQIAQQRTIAVTVNGSPSIAAPSSATVTQDVASVISPVVLSETGATGGESFTVVLHDAAGTLTATASGSASVVASGGGTTLTVSGLLGDVNHTLLTLADTDTGIASDSLTIVATDGFGNRSQTSVPITVIPAGQTYTLTTGVDIISGGPGVNTIVALTNTLSTGDEINAGSGGNNTLDLSGAGTFNLSLPTTLSGIQTIDAQEGRPAYGTSASQVQTIVLRSGMDGVTVDVTAAAASSNPKVPTISITGGNDNAVIDLASGNDTVTVGSDAETVNGGSGVDAIYVTAATIGANINGGSSGKSLLEITGGGTMTMGSSITQIGTLLLVSSSAAYNITANSIQFLTVDDASTGTDTIAAGGANQTLTGGAAGKETMVGFGTGSGSDTFADTAALFNGDTIKNFLPGDIIDLTNVSPAQTPTFVENGSFTSGVLTVTDGVHTAAITLAGDYAGGIFSVAADGSGTMVTYRIPPG